MPSSSIPSAQSAEAFLDPSLATKPKKARKPRALKPSTSAKRAKGTPLPTPRQRGSLAAPVTQKARGVMELAKRLHSANHGTGRMGLYSPPGPICLMPYSMPGAWPKAKPLFARPCPLTPRHGFVDSRSVADFDEAIDVYLEARDADASAEMLLMPRASADFSGILTHAGMTWGLGHDGATGKAGALHLPTATAPDAFHKQFAHRILSIYNSESSLSAAGIKTAAYVEIVEDGGKACVVQLRDGPEQVTTADFIPSSWRVDHIHTLEGEPDLLAWEATVQGLAKLKKAGAGPVIYYPGGTLSSHYAVHGVANGIPVVTSFAPALGDVLQPPKGGPLPLEAAHWAQVAEFVKYWEAADMDTMGVVPSFASCFLHDNHSRRTMLTMASIAVLHAQASWGPAPHLLNLRAFSAVAMAKLVAAACLGEGRHWQGAGPGGRRSLPRPMDWHIAKAKGQKKKDMSTVLQRHEVYEAALAEPLARLHPLLCQQEAEFRTIGWGTPRYNVFGRLVGEEADYGYGGPKWAECASEGRELIGALLHFMHAPSAEAWARVLMRQNNLLHVAHNGGALLNKFIEVTYMDVLAVAPGLGLANALIGAVTLGLVKQSPIAPSAVPQTLTREQAAKLKHSLFAAIGYTFPPYGGNYQKAKAAAKWAKAKAKKAKEKAALELEELVCFVADNVAKAKAAHADATGEKAKTQAIDLGIQANDHVKTFWADGGETMTIAQQAAYYKTPGFASKVINGVYGKGE